MKKKLFTAAVAALPMLAAAGCNDFLTGGELSNDPNRVLNATRDQLFTASQAALWTFLSGDLGRISSLYTQQFEGVDRQYVLLNNYELNEGTTDGVFSALYGQGGLVDLRKVQRQSFAVSDSTYAGIAQVMEAYLIGTGADVFGDIPYSAALKDTLAGGAADARATLDKQLVVYDSVQALLGRAVVNLTARGPRNIGPGVRDLTYGGSATKWLALAHTLRARFYLHTAEARGVGQYALALAEARQGIANPANDYVANFTGKPGEENLWYQFTVVQRSGYIEPNAFLCDLLTARRDPRKTEFFSVGRTGTCDDLSAARGSNTSKQPFVTAGENLLIWAESAYRTGDQTTALTQLNAARVAGGLPGTAVAAGPELLREILTEKYIALFQNVEAWNDYKRTCFPNFAPVVAGGKIPGRFLYGTTERQTNPTNIPEPGAQPVRNQADLKNGTDPFGAACRAEP